MSESNFRSIHLGQYDWLLKTANPELLPLPVYDVNNHHYKLIKPLVVACGGRTDCVEHIERFTLWYNVKVMMKSHCNIDLIFEDEYLRYGYNGDSTRELEDSTF